MVHRKIRAVTLVVLSVVFAPTFYYIYGISTNNPCCVTQEQQNVVPMRFGVYLGKLMYNETPDLNFGVWLHFNGTLVAGKEAVMDAVAYANSTYAMDRVDIIDVFFKLSVAFPIRNDSNGLPHENRVTLYHIITTPRFESTGPIRLVWPNSGDYAPTVSVILYDHSETQGDVPYVTVHVAPTTEIQTENFNRINTGLTYALVAFGIIEISLGTSEYIEGYFEAPAKSSVKNNQQQQTTNEKRTTNES